MRRLRLRMERTENGDRVTHDRDVAYAGLHTDVVFFRVWCFDLSRRGEIMHRRFGLSAAIGDQNITVTLRPTHHKPFAVCLFPIARVAFAQVVKIGI